MNPKLAVAGASEPSGAIDPLQSWWMPFTHNRRFKAKPRMIESAAGAYYTFADKSRVFDCLSGLWCTPLGHAHPGIVRAVSEQVQRLDFSPGFQLGHKPAFELAARIAAFAGRPSDRVFFANSGSEAVDTALKIAIGYHRVRGEASRTRVIGRERAYHGVGLGGISVGGIVANRKMFASMMMPGVDHLPHTYSPKDMRFSRGLPQWGTHLADDLERLVALHDASTIAAVIVEPVQGSTGLIVPPRGYLERLREICSKHGILLIFDEVITGFGRMGTPFASQFFGVQPDLTTFAKAITNGVVPMGGVLARGEIYEAFMNGPEHVIEFFHGYTYSGHPLAVAAAHAALDAMIDERLIERAAELAGVLENAVHTLRDEPHVVDIRNIGLAAAVELEPYAGRPGARGQRAFERGLDEGILLRLMGDIIGLAPPFISTEDEVRTMIESLRRTLRAIATD
jgi:beta-alanine--pyruvate transaminase